MTIYTEKDYWEDVDYIIWDSNYLKGFNASIDDIRALCVLGLPDWVAPNINFDNYTVESDILKIGEDRDDRDIFIDLNTLQVLVGSGRQLVNTSPYLLRKALQFYAIMVEKAIAIDEDSFVENRVMTSLVQELKEELTALAPACLEAGTFWFDEVERLIKAKLYGKN